MKKKGFQLSVNFMVVIILSIVLFGIGLTVFYKVVDVGTKVELKINEQTQAQLDHALDDGGIIVIPRKVVEVPAGEVAYIPFGFINEGDVGNFHVTVDSDDDTNFDDEPNGDVVLYKDFNDVKRNVRVYGTVGIVVSKEVPLGQYGFSLNVKKGSDPYGGNHKFYVYVK